MSIQDFWINIRIGASSIAQSAKADSSKLDAEGFQQAIRGGVLWLTPKAVQGFEDVEFDFLTDPERTELARAVRNFRRAAEKVPPGKPASDTQLKEARRAFAGVLEVMRPDKYADLEAFKIGKRVEQQLEQRPSWVKDLRFETGEDNAGQPAVWVWVEVDDSALKQEVLLQNTQMIKGIIERAVAEVASDRWPYVRFRSTSEQNLGASGVRR